MDEDVKKIMDGLAKAEIGLDNEFKFHCTQCGNCCRNREDKVFHALHKADAGKGGDI
ncbi:MAG: hypothetical protein OSJ73_17470 [Lachnospiraceae bacterium]|nr:hypothetical protein [Lachnospiraceae bacterium]